MLTAPASCPSKNRQSPIPESKDRACSDPPLPSWLLPHARPGPRYSVAGACSPKPQHQLCCSDPRLHPPHLRAWARPLQQSLSPRRAAARSAPARPRSTSPFAGHRRPSTIHALIIHWTQVKFLICDQADLQNGHFISFKQIIKNSNFPSKDIPDLWIPSSRVLEGGFKGMKNVPGLMAPLGLPVLGS